MYIKLKRKYSKITVLHLLFALACFNLSFTANKAYAAPSHPLGALTHEYSGNINTLSIGGSLRAGNDNDTLACGVNLNSSANLAQAVRDPANIALTGLPVGATVLAAHLYWTGSFDPDPAIALAFGLPIAGIGASTSLVPDYNVLFNGTPIVSSKNMSEFFIFTHPYFTGGVHQFDFFGGYADVTGIVAATGNALYTLSGLTVNTDGYHCVSRAVLSGWALHVVYSEPTEPFRVVKLYDGFQVYRDANIIISPSGFTVPATPKGKLAVVTWEGDEGNSTAGTFFRENLKINILPSTIPTLPLSGPLNPLVDAYSFLPNQFNGTVNTTNPTYPLLLPASPPIAAGPPAPWGVDVDHYDISAQLVTGQTTLFTGYSSGADLVILSSEMIVVDNDVFADLAISKTHVGDFGVGIPNNYTLTASNVGTGALLDEPGPITVVDTLPAGLNYVAASGTGWTCSFAGTLSCSHPGPLVKGASLPPITLTVTAPLVGIVTNTATVSGSLTDNLVLNNTSSDLTNIIAPPILTVLKSASAASATPGAVINYTVQVNNTGLGVATSVSQDDNLSTYTSLGIDCMPATVAQPTPHTITFTDGAPTSALTIGTPVFYNNAVIYVPPSLGGGICTYDPNITSFTLPMTGTMPSLGQYFLTYQTQVK